MGDATSPRAAPHAPKPSLREAEPLAQFLGRQLLTIDGPALCELLGARERYGNGLEAGVAHEFLCDLDGVGVIAGDGDRQRLAGAMRLAAEEANAHGVEGADDVGVREIGSRRVANALLLGFLQELVAVARRNRIV